MNNENFNVGMNPNLNNQSNAGMNPNLNNQSNAGMNPNINNQSNVGMSSNINNQSNAGMNPNLNNQSNAGMNSNPTINIQPNMVTENYQSKSKLNFVNLLNKYKKIIFIILLIIIVIVFLYIILGKNNGVITAGNKNEKVLECSATISIEGKEFKKIWTNYVVENGKVTKVITSEKLNLKHPKNDNVSKDDIDSVKSSCDEFDNQNCQANVDYKKNNYAKYEIILSGKHLNELNNDLTNMSDDEIIEKLKERESSNIPKKDCDLK